MRRFAIFLLAAGCLPAEMSAPLIGYLRDSAGAVRPVHGVAGAFLLGDAVEQGATAARFSGRSGCILRDGQVLHLRDGHVVDTPAESCMEEALPVAVEGDEIVLLGTGVRLRTPVAVDSVERMGSEWYVLRSASRLFALRATRGREAIYELPEAGS